MLSRLLLPVANNAAPQVALPTGCLIHSYSLLADLGCCMLRNAQRSLLPGVTLSRSSFAVVNMKL
jgi:hypothetical protein